MAKAFLPLVLGLIAAPLWAATTLHFNSSLYSFAVVEPDGWEVNVGSVAQIANFVIHPREASWRSSPTVVFGRFVPRAKEETGKDFLEEDEKRFKADCTSARVSDVDWQEALGDRYVLKSFSCKGRRHEIVAVTAVPSYFAVLILSGRDSLSVDSTVSMFKEVLLGFNWLGTKRRYWHPEAPEQPVDISGRPVSGTRSRPPR